MGFDFAVQQSFVRLLSERPPSGEEDHLARLLARLSQPVPEPIGSVLASAWRAALASVADGGEAVSARRVLLALSIDLAA